jgi:hypothetical protein
VDKVRQVRQSEWLGRFAVAAAHDEFADAAGGGYSIEVLPGRTVLHRPQVRLLVSSSRLLVECLSTTPHGTALSLSKRSGGSCRPPSLGHQPHSRPPATKGGPLGRWRPHASASRGTATRRGTQGDGKRVNMYERQRNWRHNSTPRAMTSPHSPRGWPLTLRVSLK